MWFGPPVVPVSVKVVAVVKPFVCGLVVCMYVGTRDPCSFQEGAGAEYGEFLEPGARQLPCNVVRSLFPSTCGLVNRPYWADF